MAWYSPITSLISKVSSAVKGAVTPTPVISPVASTSYQFGTGTTNPTILNTAKTPTSPTTTTSRYTTATGTPVTTFTAPKPIINTTGTGGTYTGYTPPTLPSVTPKVETLASSFPTRTTTATGTPVKTAPPIVTLATPENINQYYNKFQAGITPGAPQFGDKNTVLRGGLWGQETTTRPLTGIAPITTFTPFTAGTWSTTQQAAIDAQKAKAQAALEEKNKARDAVIKDAEREAEPVVPGEEDPSKDYVEVGGETYEVHDGETRQDAITRIQNGLNQTYQASESSRYTMAQSEAEAINNNTIKAISERTGMSEAEVRQLVGSGDPNIAIIYDEAWRRVKDIMDARKSGMSPENEGSITTPPDTAEDLGGFDAETYLKQLKEAAGIADYNTAIKDLELDMADVASFYKERRDEIRDNPEYPQWLKARRDEFVSAREERALKIYEDKLAALEKAKDAAEKLVVEYYNAAIDQQKLDLEYKQLAIQQAENASDNDRDMLKTIIETLAEQGVNWSQLTDAQRAALVANFNDPSVANALAAFDFKKAYDNQLALDWASKASTGGVSGGRTRETQDIGGMKYSLVYDAKKNLISATPLGRSGATTNPEARGDLLSWLREPSTVGKYTKEQLQSVAQQVYVDYEYDNAIGDAIDSARSGTKTGGVLGLGGTEQPTATTDPMNEFNSYQTRRVLSGLGVGAEVGGETAGGGTTITENDIVKTIEEEMTKIPSVYATREALGNAIIGTGANADLVWRWIYSIIPD